MPLHVRPLSEPLQEIAQSELNEIPNQVEENVQHLRNWLEKQEHLKYRDDDQFLLNFLRGTKFSLQRAKEKLDAFYSFRTFAPEICQNMDPWLPLMQLHLKLGISLPLDIPKCDPAGPRIFLVRYAENYDPEEITFTTLLKGTTMVYNTLLYDDDNSIVSGIKVFWDMKCLQFRTAVQVTPSLIRKTICCFEVAFPQRLKAIYFINVPKFFEHVLNMSKMLVSKKLASRMHVYSNNNLEHVFTDIPKSIFPKEYGGDAGTINDLIDSWKRRVESHRDRLLDENNYHSDESKRPETSRSLQDIYGIEGSFRKLQVD